MINIFHRNLHAPLGYLVTVIIRVDSQIQTLIPLVLPNYPAIQQAILSWFETHQRTHLPWRRTHDPYKVWVSEIMLQQTQVDRVIGFYERFLKKFPTVQLLAEAEWSEIVPYWDGLGFYRRGQNMLTCAKVVTDRYAGIFPDDLEALKKLPGIGPYTAAAICSFAFDQNTPAIDTNLERITQRVFGCTKETIKSRTEELFDCHRERNEVEFKNVARKLNAALMDIGSTICKARKANCEVCPLQEHCHFSQSGQKNIWDTSLLQAKVGKKMKSNKPKIEVACACIHDSSGNYLICQRPKHKSSTWEFAGGKRERGEDWRHCCKREIMEELKINISVRPHFFQKVWEEEEFQWDVRFFRCQILDGTPTLTEHQQLKWVAMHELASYEMPGANSEAIEKLKKFKT